MSDNPLDEDDIAFSQQNEIAKANYEGANLIKEVSRALNDDSARQLKEVIDRFRLINDQIKLREHD